MTDNEWKFSHKVYKNDPITLKSYVNKTVSIKTKDGRSYSGVVYTIDPVSESFILANPSCDKQNLKIIMGHAIDNMEVHTRTETNVLDLFLSSSEDTPESIIMRRKNAVRELLLENRFPVTENGNILNIEGILSIEPPYDEQHCSSTNEIVLVRIQELISSVVV
ncbi:gem-associated protein 6 [Neodiprion pinetum]|uniref:gem-associated protein 6-like n=1 Tax=Neodiprion fabricii TaxID=2872261 RepID=UPI001ED9230D|nr:gem-associated protein 6-like [Neodiprion fabricii]XP_046487404.1 gem-associated protein 6-like [Neodiprion pinetum]XP_046626302.1 gem-associated protein 6-like [Neodiprion virginianus]